MQSVKCTLCGCTVTDNNAIVILGKLICNCCETKIINLSGDEPEYDFYRVGLKKIWRCKEA